MNVKLIQSISFTVDGEKLTGNLIFPKEIKENNPAILFLHGWMSSQEGYAKRAETFTKRGYICLTFNLRSHGTSEGDRNKLSRNDYLNDVTAAYDFLAKQKGIDKNNIGVIGSSFGGYMACLLSHKRKLSWLVLRVAANYPDTGMDIPHVKYPYESYHSQQWRLVKRNPSSRSPFPVPW